MTLIYVYKNLKINLSFKVLKRQFEVQNLYKKHFEIFFVEVCGISFVHHITHSKAILLLLLLFLLLLLYYCLIFFFYLHKYNKNTAKSYLQIQF